MDTEALIAAALKRIDAGEFATDPSVSDATLMAECEEASTKRPTST